MARVQARKGKAQTRKVNTPAPKIRAQGNDMIFALDIGTRSIIGMVGIVEENKVLRKWYENNGFIHIGTKKFDFFPFTCGYMERDL